MDLCLLKKYFCLLLLFLLYLKDKTNSNANKVCSSDAILSCPACLTTVCIDCQRYIIPKCYLVFKLKEKIFKLKEKYLKLKDKYC